MRVWDMNNFGSRQADSGRGHSRAGVPEGESGKHKESLQ